MPYIFDYFDYVRYLNDVYLFKKRENTSFSLGVWTRSLDLKAKSQLSMVLNGKKSPSKSLIAKLVDYLRLNQEEEDHLKSLVQFHKLNCDDLVKKRALSFLKKNDPKKMESTIVSDELFSLISHWSYFLMRELCQTKGFKEDADWVQSVLRMHLNKSKIDEIINTLRSLGLISKDYCGRFQQTDRNITTTDNKPSPAIQNYHLEMSDLSKELIKKSDADERWLSSVIFHARKSDLQEMKKNIRLCEDEFLRTYEKDPKQSDVLYAFNIQILPLTNS